MNLPTEKLLPFSDTSLSRFLSQIWDNSNAEYICSSAICSDGSRLKRKEPVNSTGSCGIIDKFDLRFLRGNSLISLSSMMMLPSVASIMRNLDKKIQKIQNWSYSCELPYYLVNIWVSILTNFEQMSSFLLLFFQLFPIFRKNQWSN